MSVTCACCQIGVCATGRSLVQSSPTHSGVSGCDLETSTTRRPTRAVGQWGVGALMFSYFLCEAVLGSSKYVEGGGCDLDLTSRA